jgi:hypothetical protein
MSGEGRNRVVGWSEGWNEKVCCIAGEDVVGIIGKQGDMFAKWVMPYALATADVIAGGITRESVCSVRIVLRSQLVAEDVKACPVVWGSGHKVARLFRWSWLR